MLAGFLKAGRRGCSEADDINRVHKKRFEKDRKI
jgi:hypothetical protein